jgi:hypothetical protein
MTQSNPMKKNMYGLLHAGGKEKKHQGLPEE